MCGFLFLFHAPTTTTISTSTSTHGRIRLGRSAVPSGALNAVASERRLAAMQKIENFELMKSDEGDS